MPRNGPGICITSFSHFSSSVGQIFRDEKTEAQSVEVTFLRLYVIHSKGRLISESSLFNTKVEHRTNKRKYNIIIHFWSNSMCQSPEVVHSIAVHRFMKRSFFSLLILTTALLLMDYVLFLALGLFLLSLPQKFYPSGILTKQKNNPNYPTLQN